MQPSTISYLVYGALAVALGWYYLDMRSIIKSMQRRNQLSIEGRWTDVEKHFERQSKSYRPFVRLHQRYLLPGSVATQHALFLHKQGRLEEALAKVDKAIRQVEGKPRMFESIHRLPTFKTLCGALNARTLILTGLGRYDDARANAHRLEQLTGSSGRANAPLALLEYYCGHLDEALALAQVTPPEDAHYDGMRGVMALVLSAKGDFEQAVQALSYEPSDINKFYTPEGRELVGGTPDGEKLIELQRAKLAGVTQPARLIRLAQVYVTKEEFASADRALDQAEKSLGPEPAIQASYCRYRAWSMAGQGKADEAADYIERMRKIVDQYPKRSFLWEMRFAAGRCHLYLGRLSDALAEFTEAQRHVLHPIEKHATAYWIARTNEAAGNKREAARHYQMVAADTIPSWMRKSAIEAIGRLGA